MSEPTPADRPTMAPFLAALAVVALVAIGIALFNLLGDNEPSAQQQVARAAVAQNDALQRKSYADFRAHTCAAERGTEADMLAGQQDSVESRGERFVDDVTDVEVDGDRASAKVTYHFDNAPDAKTSVTMSFVREDGAWKVCSAGPR
ncbi:lumazine-binding protein [Mycolicibacterium pulveris]|uniref:Rv0361 family membrane protein n=1 Tax=Mycolicibacterium pulveris TaxID=36813 RepID=UPI003CE8A6BC